MKLKYVDGFKIRDTIDPDFGVIGSNRIYAYIPKNEIWFDKQYLKEKQHFMKIHLFELKLMKRMSYEKARKIVEKSFLRKKPQKERIPNFIVKKGNYKDFKIEYVDGRIIRKFIDPKFILGMHSALERGEKGKSKKEIWIDIWQDKREYKYTLIHEYEEALLMMKGMGYNDAHDFALAYEKAARRKDGAIYLRD